MPRKRELFEHRGKAVISGAAFAGRMLRWLSVTLSLLAASLLVGVLGYRYFEGMSWIDALLNAAMILGGMGEVNALQTVGGKLFAAAYAIYCGIFLVICGGLLLAPLFHRVLHHFHADR
ncbi:MAG: hypothetical protein ACREEP_11015 [Dongiaceae bacterium]